MAYYKTALAIIFNQHSRILLSRRFEPSHKPSHNKWQLPGGGIEKGESCIEAVIREVREEANIEIKLLSDSPIIRTEPTNKSGKIQIELNGFPAVYVSGTISCESDPESSDIGWFEYQEIDFPNTLPGTKELIDEGLKLWKKS